MERTNSFICKFLENTISEEIEIILFEKEYWSDCTSWRYSIEIKYGGLVLYMEHWPFGEEDTISVEEIRIKIEEDIQTYEAVSRGGTDSEVVNYIYDSFQYMYKDVFFKHKGKGWRHVKEYLTEYIGDFKKGFFNNGITTG